MVDLIAIFVGAGVAVIAILFLLLILRARAARQEAAMALGGEAHVQIVDFMANLRAVESKGLIQVSGNGCLALSDSKLIFVMWLPRRTILIRRKDIVGVETPTSFMGKWSGRPMLRVHWKSEDSARDSAAWLVRHVHAWVRELQTSSGG